jgi:DNA replication protein DnaC
MKHPTHEALRRLRLYGMARGLEDLERQPERSQLSFDDQLALLVERETAERANTALASRLKRARLRQTACLEDLDWRTPRGLDRTLVRDLASCRWVREHQPLLVTGPTGIGKTFVACALGNQAAREGYGVFYTRLTRLLDDLATARLDGSLARVLRRLARLEVLIIDDWAMTELTAARPDGSDRRPARPRRHGAGDPDPRGKLAPLDRRCHLRRRDPRPRRSPGAAYRTHGRVHASGAGGRPEIS